MITHNQPPVQLETIKQNLSIVMIAKAIIHFDAYNL